MKLLTGKKSKKKKRKLENNYSNKYNSLFRYSHIRTDVLRAWKQAGNPKEARNNKFWYESISSAYWVHNLLIVLCEEISADANISKIHAQNMQKIAHQNVSDPYLNLSFRIVLGPNYSLE